MERNGLFPAAVALAGGLVLSTIVGARALVKLKSQDQAIAVTGSAKRRIRSDRIVWGATVSNRAADRAAAYRGLAAAVPKVTAYLKGQGIAEGEIVVSSVTTTAFHPHDQEGRDLADVINGYEMKQRIEVRSADVERVERVSRKATELIDQGVAIDSSDPEYHYTKLGDLKIQMLAEAARDAKLRAEQIAASTGSRIGALRSARMGVMQVNAADESETDAEGMNDTSSLEKDVMAVVSSSFTLE